MRSLLLIFVSSRRQQMQKGSLCCDRQRHWLDLALYFGKGVTIATTTFNREACGCVQYLQGGLFHSMSWDLQSRLACYQTKTNAGRRAQGLLGVPFIY